MFFIRALKSVMDKFSVWKQSIFTLFQHTETNALFKKKKRLWSNPLFSVSILCRVTITRVIPCIWGRTKWNKQLADWSVKNYLFFPFLLLPKNPCWLCSYFFRCCIVVGHSRVAEWHSLPNTAHILPSLSSAVTSITSSFLEQSKLIPEH